jgi:hypothetical protein
MLMIMACSPFMPENYRAGFAKGKPISTSPPLPSPGTGSGAKR